MRRSGLVLLALLAALAVDAPATARRAHDCVKGNELWFRSADGVKLVGHRFGGVRPGAKTVVVLAHQSGGSVCEWLTYARRLARLGFFAFPFDFRGNGFSKGRQRPTRYPGDVAAAVRAMRALGARKVVVVGSSMGGIATLIAAANIRPAVVGVVSLSAPATYQGMDALRTAPRLTVPVLYAAGRDEPVVAGYDFAGSAQKLYDATASEDKRLELVPSDLHGIALLESTRRCRRSSRPSFAPARVGGVTALLWASLALFLAALVGGVAFCLVVAVRGWRTFRDTSRLLTRSLEERLSAAEALALRAKRAGARSEEVLAAVGRLRRSIARAQVLLVAFGEVTSLWSALRRLVPVK
jgi:pimeloyl-ACP methyl ester carboxylesterase